MRIIAIKNLHDFWKTHPEAKAPLEAWVVEARHATWKNAHDIKIKYRNASLVGNKHVVFNIKGNDYRLIVAVAYRFGAVYITFIGTHKEYDKVNAATVEME